MVLHQTGTNRSEAGIRSLYHEARVLVTGSTGFVGQVLIEFLLRKTEVAKIYMLIRPKKGKTSDERIKDVLNSELFSRIKRDSPEMLSRVTLINGDIEIVGLGLSEEDRRTLSQEVEVIFHGAAIVSLQENLKRCSDINLTGTRHLLDLATTFLKLKVLMHISTAYSNCHLDEVGEEIYPLNDGINLEQLVGAIDRNTADQISQYVIKETTNTYVYTKRSAENLIQCSYRDMPIGIFRPSIVIGAAQEPLPGWIDNLNGPTSILIGLMTGFTHCSLIKKDAIADVIPVDVVVNALIAASWHAHNRYLNEPKSDVPIYNCTSGSYFKMTWGQLMSSSIDYARKSPPKDSVWYPFMYVASSYASYRFAAFFLHYMIGFIFDRISLIMGGKANKVKTYSKIHKLIKILEPFSTRQWYFRDDNTRAVWDQMTSEERVVFPFNLKDIDWSTYLQVYLDGIRKYILRDMIDKEKDSKLAKKLAVFHFATIILGISLLFVGAGFFIPHFMKTILCIE